MARLFVIAAHIQQQPFKMKKERRKSGEVILDYYLIDPTYVALSPPSLQLLKLISY